MSGLSLLSIDAPLNFITLRARPDVNAIGRQSLAHITDKRCSRKQVYSYSCALLIIQVEIVVSDENNVTITAVCLFFLKNSLQTDTLQCGVNPAGYGSGDNEAWRVLVKGASIDIHVGSRFLYSIFSQ